MNKFTLIKSLLSIIAFVLVVNINRTFSQSDITVSIDGEKQAIGAPINLKSGYHEIVFDLSSIKSNKYFYKLSGLETDWKLTIYPIARYTNLPGGVYEFNVKGVGLNKIGHSPTAKVTLEIREDFWEKWWFLGFVSLIVISIFSLIIYFWFLYDFRQKSKVDSIRQRIAADLHDEVGANLNSITFMTEMLRNESKKNNNLDLILDKISSNSMESASLISDTIWALNPVHDSFEKLLERIKSFGLGILSAKDIAFSIQNNLHKEVDLSIDQRRNIYLIMKEAIHNIAKHSDAKKANLLIDIENGTFSMVITDDGQGFDITINHNGNGLKNYQSRAVDTGIIVEIESTIGNGTKLSLFVKSIN